MGQISGIPTQNDGDLYEAEYTNEIVTEHNETDNRVGVNETNISSLDDRVTDIEAIEGNIVTQLSDLPTPSAGKIVLSEDNVDWVFKGVVDIGTNRIEVTGQNVKLRGTYAERDGISTTATGSIITNTTSNLLMENMCVNAPNATEVYTFANSNTKIFQLEKVKINSTGKLGTITNPLSFSVFDIVIFNTTAPFTIVGNGGGAGIIGRFVNSISFGTTGAILDLGTSVFSAIDIGENAINGQVAGASFLTIADDGANITAEGEGTISRNKFVDTVGGLTAITGDYVFSTKWEVVLNTSNILPSDRLAPAGFGNYDDDLSGGNIAVTTSWTKITINGLGGATRIDKLPLSIRGVQEFFDTTTNTIKGITDGDDFVFRLPLTIASTSGNPTYLEFALDIGTSEVTPNNIILKDSRDLNNVTDQPIIFDSGYFTGSTFIANEGRFFVRTDGGTCNISNRSTKITRTSSGAN